MNNQKLTASYWYQKLIAPRGITPDEQRRELILNILLAGLAGIAVVSSVVYLVNYLVGFRQFTDTGSVVSQAVALATIGGLWWLSRRGKYKFSTYVLLGFLLLGATQLLLAWSFVLPMTQLFFVVLLVIAGVLLSARSALLVTFGLAFYVLLLSYMQTSGYLHPNKSWLNQDLQMGDSVVFAACLLIIGLVSWLANREIDNSLTRARRSEAALEQERDQLEIKVVERTRQLEQAQMQRVMELQRLAEFGRLSAGLLHDVASPLTVASLNLKELGNKSHSQLLSRAMQSLQYIERFLDAARKQLKSQGNITEFAVTKELQQVLSILNHRAREEMVSIKIAAPKRYRLTADPVKFNQIMANLILNGIEAYQGTKIEKRELTISLAREKESIRINVIDHGRGLTKDQIEHIFEPFYTTKPEGRHNMGIGLVTVKKLVETDFLGRIKVTSSKRYGTCFTIWLRSVIEIEDR